MPKLIIAASLAAIVSSGFACQAQPVGPDSLDRWNAGL